MPLTEQRSDESNCLLEAVNPVIERHAKAAELRFRPAGSEAED
jgi:hypothetical protein